MCIRAWCAVGTFVLAAQPALAQSQYSTQVISYTQGSGGGIFDTDNILGGPQGGGLSSGSLDVLTLGDNGQVTLGFDVTLQDGPGADLSVFENGFFFGTSVFAELAFVEVSTNGIDFARFPTSFSQQPMDATPIGVYGGLTGGTPVIANVMTDPLIPFDPVRSGGESFDLADLALDPLVQSGLVDLQDLHFVRIVDALGSDVDSNGVPIVNFGSADIDAVALLHYDTEPANGPICDLSIDAQGFLRLTLGDPDGFDDLDFSTLSVSRSLVPLSSRALRRIFEVSVETPTQLELTSVLPAVGLGAPGTFSVSVRDMNGTICGDQVVIQN